MKRKRSPATVQLSTDTSAEGEPPEIDKRRNSWEDYGDAFDISSRINRGDCEEQNYLNPFADTMETNDGNVRDTSDSLMEEEARNVETTVDDVMEDFVHQTNEEVHKDVEEDVVSTNKGPGEEVQGPGEDVPIDDANQTPIAADDVLADQSANDQVKYLL
ncbi:unnamed protein product [Cochlearia groenlandica]